MQHSVFLVVLYLAGTLRHVSVAEQCRGSAIPIFTIDQNGKRRQKGDVTPSIGASLTSRQSVAYDM